MGLDQTVTDGVIPGIRQIDDLKLIQISAPISPGSSGGPVVNLKGEVIGVATFNLKIGQNLNFAMPASKVQSLGEGEEEIDLVDKVVTRSRENEEKAPSIIFTNTALVPSRWLVDFTLLFHYQGKLLIQMRLDSDRYKGKIIVDYQNKTGKKYIASQDTLITIKGNPVIIQCSNPSLRGWDMDIFYLELRENKMVGYSQDTRNRRGTAVLTFVKESVPDLPPDN